MIRDNRQGEVTATALNLLIAGYRFLAYRGPSLARQPQA